MTFLLLIRTLDTCWQVHSSRLLFHGKIWENLPNFQSPVKMRLTLHIYELAVITNLWEIAKVTLHLLDWLVSLFLGKKSPNFIFVFLEYLPQKIPDLWLELEGDNTNYITFPKSELIHRLTRGSLAMIFSWNLIEMTDDNSYLLITALMVW